MKNLTTFQLALLVGFVALAIAGVIVFATFRAGTRDALPPIVIWGTLDDRVMRAIIDEIKAEDERFDSISYVKKDPRTYQDEFVNALAVGTGPDLLLVGEQDIFDYSDKIITIPFDSYSGRVFQNTFVEAGEIFLTSTGIRALPFTIDPLVMYWNRDIFVDGGLANPPSFWDEFLTLSPKFTQRDDSTNIVRSFVALGEFRNVMHAKEILSALMLQAGNPIVVPAANGGYISTLKEKYDNVELPAVAALRFYTEFASPTKAVYSWNRALPGSRQSFVQGDVGVYFGPASEYRVIRELNPNLNFDVAAFPQPRGSARPITFAHVEGWAIPRGSVDSNAAFLVAQKLTSAFYVSRFSTLTGLPPVRRDLLGDTPADAVKPVFYNGALSARTWLDPDTAATDGIFQEMIEAPLAGRLKLGESVESADAKLSNLFRQ